MKILRESAQINTVAEKQYLDGLTQGYIDIDAFHLAYDDIILDAHVGLENLFYKRQDRVLKSRGSYGDIKLMKGFNDPVYNAMISLWLAQFKNNLPLKHNVLNSQASSISQNQVIQELPLDYRIELVKKAFDILNKAKGVNFEVADLRDSAGGVSFAMTYPSGRKHIWGFPESWFNPEHTHSDAVTKMLSKIPSDWTDEQKIIAKMMAYIWSIRENR